MGTNRKRSTGRSGILFFAVLFFALPAYSQIQDSIRDKIRKFLLAQPMAYPLLEKLSREIGHRLTASKNGVAAENFIYSSLKTAGIQEVAFDTFEVKAWQRQTCDLEVVPYRSDNFTPIKAVSLANTPSSDALLHLLDGGDGLEADLIKLGDKIKDKCLVINLGLTKTDSGRKNLHRAEKVALAIKYGAKGVVLVHPAKGNRLLTGTASLTGEIIGIPALCVSGDDGKEIRNWMKTERLMAQIRIKNHVAEGTARNVVARIPSPVQTKETIVFCGHLDSWDLATGATDNGLGAFTLIDIARAVQEIQPHLKRNVIVLWTMGEEQGLLGSTHFVAGLKKSNRLNDIRAVVNLDMTGNPSGLNGFDWPGAESWFGEFSPSFTKYCPSFLAKNSSAPGLHSDHEPFMLEGIPTFSANSNLPDSIYACYHANCDNLGLIRPSYLETSALVHSLLAYQLAANPTFPLKPMKPKKLKKWLEKHNLKEKLIISNQWRWKK